jgi:CDP-glucose 4,6-dehydratase
VPTRITPNFWSGKRVFITGGTGLLGGWSVRRLLEMGAEVIALVRDGVPSSMAARDGNLGRVSTIQGSLEDAELMLRAMAEYEIDTVLHLAAQPIVGVAKLDPVGTFRANIEGTWNILEAARRTKVKQTIIASSDKAYGESNDLPYLEDHPLVGRYPYDCSKSCADLIAQTYLTTYKMPVSIVRCANMFGGGDLNFNRLIPGVIQATAQGHPFVIRSDGKFVRDYLYVRDAADAYLHLAECLAEGAPQGAYNFSLETRLTVLEIVDQVLRLMDRTDLKPVVLNQASAEMREQFMSCAKARGVLGWAPAYFMEQGLRETIDWYTSHFQSMNNAQEEIVLPGQTVSHRPLPGKQVGRQII